MERSTFTRNFVRKFAKVFALVAVSTAGRGAYAEDPAPPSKPENCTNILQQGPCKDAAYQFYPLNGSPCDPSKVFDPQGAGMGQGALPAPVAPQQAASTGAVSQLGYAPNFIGDSYGSGGIQSVPIYFGYYSTPSVVAVPSGGIGSAPNANVGKIKLVENTSPLPRDRVFVNYSYFDNTPLFAGGVGVNRVTPGVEKTFFGGWSSIEIRTPFASTISNTIQQDAGGNFISSDTTQFGNLTTYLKTLLYKDESLALAAGLGVAFPTGQAYSLNDQATGETLMHVSNNSVHLLPYLGAVYSPNSRFFAQGMLQFDVDANGNDVAMRELLSTANPLESISRSRDAAWMYGSVAAGYWVMRDPTTTGWITGIAPIAELHYNQTLQSADGVNGTFSSGNTVFVDKGPAVQLLNTTLGVNFLLREQASLTVGYSTPIGSGSDKQFSSELRVLFNWYFGSTNRFTQVQF